MAQQQNDPDGSGLSPATVGEKQVDKVVISGDIGPEQGALEPLIRVVTDYKNLDLYLKIASKKFLATVYITAGAIITGVAIEGSSKKGLEALAEILTLREGVYFLHRWRHPAGAGGSELSMGVEGILSELKQLFEKSQAGDKQADPPDKEEAEADQLSELEKEYKPPKVSSQDVEDYSRPYNYVMMTGTNIPIQKLQSAEGWIDLLESTAEERSRLQDRLRNQGEKGKKGEGAPSVPVLHEEVKPLEAEAEIPGAGTVTGDAVAEAAEKDSLVAEPAPDRADQSGDMAADGSSREVSMETPQQSGYAPEVKPFQLPAVKLSGKSWLMIGGGLLAAVAFGLLAAFLLRPDSYMQHLEQGEVLMREGKFDLARDEFRLAESEDPGRSQAYLYLARSYGMEGRWQEAGKIYSKYLAIDSNDAVAYYERANTYYEQGKFQDAIADAEKAMGLDKQLAEPYLVKARSLVGMGKHAQAVRICDRVLSLPIATLQESEAYALRGDAFMKQRNFQQAIADYSKAIEVRPDREELLALRGQCYGKKGELAKALEDFARALKVSDHSALIYLRRGEFYLDSKNYKKAVEDLTSAIDQDPGLQQAYVSRASAYTALRRYSLARADLLRVAELKKGKVANRVEHQKAGAAVRKAEKPEKPVDRARDTDRQAAKNKEDLLARGKIQLDSGDNGAAIRTLSQVVRSSPGNVRARRYLANAYRRQGNRHQAQKQLEALEKMGAASPVDRLDLARMWIASGQRQKAADLARKGMQSARSERVSSQFRAILESLGE